MRRSDYRPIASIRSGSRKRTQKARAVSSTLDLANGSRKDITCHNPCRHVRHGMITVVDTRRHPGHAMSTTTTSAIPDLDRPVAKFRWLKRIAGAVALLLIVLCCARWWWGVYANRRLQAEIDRIKAAGEPILFEDFVLPPIPDADNAAIPLTEAAQIVVALGADPDQLDDKRFFDAHTQVKALIQDARSRRDCAWSLRADTSGDDAAVVFLTYEHPRAYLQLCGYLGEAAKRQHDAENDAAAVETIADMLFLARRLEAPPAFTVGWLIANGARAQATQSLQGLIATLRLARSEADGDTRPVTRDRIQALIDELLNEAPTVAYCAAALRAERMPLARVGKAVAEKPIVRIGMPAFQGESGVFGSAADFAFKPAFVLDCLQAMEQAGAIADAATAANRPGVQAALGEMPSGISSVHRITELLSRMLEGPWRATLDTRFYAATRTRMAATAMAMRLYEVDHGRRPTKLAELVPDYLTRLPADPFAADGRAIAYEPKAIAESDEFFDRRIGKPTTVPLTQPHPVLYSVGPDGRDDRGSGRSHIYRRDKTGDIVFYLNEYRSESETSAVAPGMSASRKAREDDDEVADQDGGTDEDEDPKQQPADR